MLDQSLCWNHHVFELRKKLNRAVGMLYKLRNLKQDLQVLKMIYYSLFHSHASYGLCAWGATAHNLVNIFLVQKRAIRAIAGLGFQESTSDAFKNLGILKHNILK